MFVAGLDLATRTYFSAATAIIAIPTAIKISNWLSSIWAGVLYVSVALLFIVGFLACFTFGGFSGLILSNCTVDRCLHDTFFVVGHFHYVLSLGAVYTVIASLYHVLPQLLSLHANDHLGRAHFAVFFMSSNCLFLGMHTMGLLGMPRRVNDYSATLHRHHSLSATSSVGLLVSLAIMFGALLLVVPSRLWTY